MDSTDTAIEEATRVIIDALRSGHRLLICGNGGSCAQAMHMAAELTGHFESPEDRPPIAAIALCADPVAMSAIANDYGFEHVYSRQVLAIGSPGDVLLAISTSGASPSVIEAADAAISRRMFVVALTGRDGGPLAGACEVAIVVRSESTAKIQEAHTAICHAICSAVERALCGSAGGGRT